MLFNNLQCLNLPRTAERVNVLSGNIHRTNPRQFHSLEILEFHREKVFSLSHCFFFFFLSLIIFFFFFMPDRERHAGQSKLDDRDSPLFRG